MSDVDCYSPSVAPAGPLILSRNTLPSGTDHRLIRLCPESNT